MHARQLRLWAYLFRPFELTMLTHEMQIVKITADVVPKPITTAVEHYAVLFAIVIVRLIFAPCWLQYSIACHIYHQINVKTKREREIETWNIIRLNVESVDGFDAALNCGFVEPSEW